MTCVEIRKSPCFSLYSHGNGLAYELRSNLPYGFSIFVQGDDAAEFRAELELYESAWPENSTEEVLREMVARYRH